MNNKIKIIIADDHPIVRQGLRQIVECETDIEILTEANDGAAALEKILELKPDIAVLDIDMPQMNGLEILRAVQGKYLLTRIILMTVHSEEEFFNEALELGAHGYILMDSAIEDIINAVRAAVAGQNYVSPVLTTLLFKKTRRENSVKMNSVENLTKTERQIVKFIAECKTNNQIADMLFISPLTVKTHRRNINQKLELEGNHALMRFASENKNQL